MNEGEYGRRLGAYEIVDTLGRGGMAVVYKARQESLDRFVALKVLAPELARDQEFVARFQGEAATAARLEHPHIVPIYDVGEAEGSQYIAMRYVGGGTLGELLGRVGPLPLTTALVLLAQIAEALDHAHAHAVVHRDLKPGNILLEPTGDRASLTDFGIARAGEGSRLTRLGQVAGTPEYMSPEQAQGGPVDARTDLYALGIVAYEMLTGRVPFEADSGIAVLHQQVYSPPPALRSVRPDVPPVVDRALARMLAKNPSQRFPSGAAFIAALHGRATPTSVPAIAPIGTGPTRRVTVQVATKRPSGGVLLPVAAAAAALMLIAGVLLLASRPPADVVDASVIEQATAVQSQQVLPTATTAVLVATQAPSPTLAPTSTATARPTQAPTPSSTPVPPPPSLAANDFSPKSLQPGDRFTLTYEILNPGGAGVRVLLGASIRPTSGGATIDDAANDESVTVQPGRGVYQRVFRVPPGTVPGRYDVLWGLIGPDRQSFGLQTEPGALVVTASAAAISPPLPQPSLASPATVVRQFYTLIGQRNFTAAWDLLSPQLQRSRSYSSWLSGFDATKSVDVPSASVVSQTGTAATVSVTVGSIDADSSGRSIHKTFQGTWDLVLTGGAWKLQSSDMKQVG